MPADVYDGKRAQVVVDSPEGNYCLSAPWAVAADGFHSVCRAALGFELEWSDYGTDSAVADFEMTYPLPENRSNIVLDPRRPYGLFAFAPGRWRFIYRINDGEDRTRMTSEDIVRRLVTELLPQARVTRFLWASAFRLGQGHARSYRKGRWILAGDAAHAMGPSAGAGMMIGLLGAWRLGPQLAAALNRPPRADESLKIYQHLQHAAATRAQKDNAFLFRQIALRNPVLAAVRTVGLSLAGRIPKIGESIARSTALLNHPSPLSEIPTLHQI